MDRIRVWAHAGLLAQVAFVASWLVAGFWQVRAYDPVAHSISDMYALDAPHAAFLVMALTVCGALTILFALLAVRRALRPAGWPATVGAVLLALSIFGLGDLLSPFEREACQRATAGCDDADQVANAGGTLDAILSLAGLALLIAAGFVLAAAMRRIPAWRRWVWPTRWATIVIMALLLANGLAGAADLGGLFERLLATAGAAGIAALAIGVGRIPSG